MTTKLSSAVVLLLVLAAVAVTTTSATELSNIGGVTVGIPDVAVDLTGASSEFLQQLPHDISGEFKQTLEAACAKPVDAAETDAATGSTSNTGDANTAEWQRSGCTQQQLISGAVIDNLLRVVGRPRPLDLRAPSWTPPERAAALLEAARDRGDFCVHLFAERRAQFARLYNSTYAAYREKLRAYLARFDRVAECVANRGIATETLIAEAAKVSLEQIGDATAINQLVSEQVRDGVRACFEPVDTELREHADAMCSLLVRVRNDVCTSECAGAEVYSLYRAAVGVRANERFCAEHDARDFLCADKRPVVEAIAAEREVLERTIRHAVDNARTTVDDAIDAFKTRFSESAANAVKTLVDEAKLRTVVRVQKTLADVEREGIEVRDVQNGLVAKIEATAAPFAAMLTEVCADGSLPTLFMRAEPVSDAAGVVQSLVDASHGDRVVTSPPVELSMMRRCGGVDQLVRVRRLLETYRICTPKPSAALGDVKLGVDALTRAFSDSDSAQTAEWVAEASRSEIRELEMTFTEGKRAMICTDLRHMSIVAGSAGSQPEMSQPQVSSPSSSSASSLGASALLAVVAVAVAVLV